MSGYDEQTLIHPQDNAEVYGQDGYGWYCDKATAAKHFPKVETTQSLNPVFVNLTGMTRAKLSRRNFIKV